MHLAAQRIFQVLIRQNMELLQYAVHAPLVDGVQTVGRGSHGSEPDLMESEILFQVPEDPHHIGHAIRQRHPRRDRHASGDLDQRPDSRRNNVVTAPAVGEDAQLIL